MADLGSIGVGATNKSHVAGGVISGLVTAAGGSPAADRVVSYFSRTLYSAVAIPVLEKTISKSDGTYSFAGMDSSFSTPHKYLVLITDDDTSVNAIVYDKVSPA